MTGLRQPRSRRDVDDAAQQELLAESPRLFLGGVVVVVLMDVVSWFMGEFHPLDPVMIALVSFATVATWRRLVGAPLLPWLWALVVLACIGILCVQLVTMQSIVTFGYILILAAVFPPLALMWRPTVVVGVGVLVLTGITTVATTDTVDWAGQSPVDAMQQVVAALAGGVTALYFRRRSLATGLRVTSRLETTAQTDRLTGVLNRRGLEERGVGMVAGRRSADRQVFALFIDVDGLKSINDSRGHDSGDRAICAVAQAAAAVVRVGDLLGRWGGDEFVILGVGDAPDPEVVERRIADRLRVIVSDDIGRLGVSVGGATGSGNLLRLIAEADADMYGRRARSRGQGSVDQGDLTSR